ncbi:MAG TPA: NepR family anti-sigma factor [Devosia sp.]
MRDKTKMNDMTNPRPRRADDGLGPTSDIGAKLRALYGAVQNEGIPERLLDLLEKLDQAEQKANAADKSE